MLAVKYGNNRIFKEWTMPNTKLVALIKECKSFPNFPYYSN